ncbi:pentapeptide repeat-containing protein, partial [bacterium]|nr:pentapeptide repeat-containing protein [bacterium]
MEVNGYTIKRGANLSGANLTNANLTNANLSAADLDVGRRNSEWTRRNQNGPTLYDPVTWPIPPSYFDMTPTNLSGANLSGANL